MRSRAHAGAAPQKTVERPVSKAGDRLEHEAEQAAQVVARGGSVSGWSFSGVPVSAPDPVQRDEAGKPKTDEEKKKEADDTNTKEALKKAGEAALETPQGKAVKEKVLADPLVKKVVDAATSPAGLVTVGAALVGGVTALAATGKELPVQPPEIPLEKLSSKLAGVSAQVTWEGPVASPTAVGLTITIREQGKGKSKKTDPIAADVARVNAQREMFRSENEKAAEKAQEDEMVKAWLSRQRGSAFTIPVPLPPAKKDEPATPAQPAPASPSAAPPGHANVDDALVSPGRPLEPGARRAMEARFGYDFSGVRVHDDARAAATAAGIDAAAFTVGEDVVFGTGRYDPAGPDGRRLLAHELAHVVQQRLGSGRPVQRAPQAAPVLTPPERRDYEEFVDTALRYLDGARDHFRTLAEVARVSGGARPGAQQQQPAPAEPAAGSPQAPAQQPAPAEPAPGRLGQQVPQAPPALTPERLHTVLEGLLRTYEGSRAIIARELGGDVTRADRLATAYQGAVDAARAAAAGMGRVNIVLIAAPKDDHDAFIANATTYANLYFATPSTGDTVHIQGQIDSPDALFDAIETTEADRMIRRVDIFCHGTIEPTHQIKFGASWFRIDQIQAAAAARARTGRTLSNQTRFDGSTVIELHACRLGAPDSQPGTSGMDTTHGEDFLRGFGASVGGARGEQVTGYVQRWVPRRFDFPGVRSTSDLGTGARARTFDRIAVRTFDTVMVGSVEVQSQLTEAERAGAAIPEARKIAIMRHLYDAAGGAWLIGHQYSTATPQSADPVRDRPGARDTFTNEADWTHLVLTVTVPAPPAAPGAGP